MICCDQYYKNWL